ncbi:MAG: His/Gly/Thr/Pro-type tRNA ligase C-terminal domain-containing protein, partial [Syntrophomonadaceae bacterium]
ELQALELLTRLRQENIRAEKDYMGRSGRAQMKYADKLGARMVIIIGDDEIQQGYFTLRDMQSKEQVQIDKEEIIESVKDRLAKLGGGNG